MYQINHQIRNALNAFRFLERRGKAERGYVLLKIAYKVYASINSSDSGDPDLRVSFLETLAREGVKTPEPTLIKALEWSES